MGTEQQWGPNNPHPLSRMRTELIWEGKYDEYGRRREVQLPSFPLVLQKVETIDEPRDRERAEQGTLFDEGAFTESAHRDDFRNRLIWGDNKLALGGLLPEFRNKVKLIYIDPPFDVGADFTLQVTLGENEDEVIEKEQSLIEAVAYRDTWGKGSDSYIEMLSSRLSLMKELLCQDGAIFVHCDWRVAAKIRLLLDEHFGPQNFRNEIVWHYPGREMHINTKFNSKHDTIFFYSVSDQTKIFMEAVAPAYDRDERIKGLRRKVHTDSDGKEWVWETRGQASGQEPYKRYIDEIISKGKPLSDVWDDTQFLRGNHPERTDYATQKPEALVGRIVEAITKQGDLVADFFCGSGTTLAVAEKLGRRWIGGDLGRYAIHTARKRLIGIQRELHKENRPYRSFDVYNLGRYERQWWQMERLKGANEEHRATVLKFFKANPVANPASPQIHGLKGGAYVHVDDIDSIFTFTELRDLSRELASIEGIEDWQNTGTLLSNRNKPKLVVLAWEFEMDLRRRAQGVEAEMGIEIDLKYIPREIMEPNRDTVQFFDAAALDGEAFQWEYDGKKLTDVRLTSFIPALTEVPEKELEALKERAVRSPFDFIDFWAVDFEYREDKPFEHHWQDYRTRKDRALKISSDLGWEYQTKGTKRICVKVIDVFGIDTTKVIEVEI